VFIDYLSSVLRYGDEDHLETGCGKSMLTEQVRCYMEEVDKGYLMIRMGVSG